MIVSIKLSIPDEKFWDIQYYSKKLQEMAKPNYPGFIHYKFAGYQGTTAASRQTQQKRAADPPACKLFS